MIGDQSKYARVYMIWICQFTVVSENWKTSVTINKNEFPKNLQ